jgi:hypothetical protein
MGRRVMRVEKIILKVECFDMDLRLRAEWSRRVGEKCVRTQ